MTARLISHIASVIMASKCKTCNEEILSPDFIKCYGTCSSVFHSKCVSIGKTLLNALGGNANIRWYCHDCHVNDYNVASSMNEIKSSIGQLSSSLSSDLGKFLNSMSDMTKMVSDSIRFLSTSNSHKNDSAIVDSTKRRRDEHHPPIPGKFRRIATQSSNHHRMSQPNAINYDGSNSHESTDKRKSIVVSNISPNISIDELINFVSSKLKIDRDSVRITTLMPRSVKADELKFMQYRVSVPDRIYNSEVGTLYSSVSVTRCHLPLPSTKRSSLLLLKPMNKLDLITTRRPVKIYCTSN